MILKIIHNIFNLRDTEVVICIILVLLERVTMVSTITVFKYKVFSAEKLFER